MKKQYIALALLAAMAPAPAFCGHAEGNGGDAYALEFTAIAQKVESYLASHPSSGAAAAIDAKAFENAIDTTTVESTDDVLYLDGVPKDLINYPRDHEIELSRPRWRSMIDSQKHAIVTHELLGIMGIDDRHYQISSQLLSDANLDINTSVTEGSDDPSFAQWCTDSAAVLQNALTVGYQATTSEQEKTILLSGIDAALAEGSTRQNTFFTATLQAAKADILSFPNDTSEQVNVLRTYIQFAIEDLTAFSRPGADPNDNGAYVQTMIRRAIGIGALSKTNVEELNVLDRAAERGVLLIDSSDYRRTPGYACLRQTLNNALAISSDDSLTVQTQVLLLRQALGSVTNPLPQCN